MVDGRWFEAGDGRRVGRAGRTALAASSVAVSAVERRPTRVLRSGERFALRHAAAVRISIVTSASGLQTISGTSSSQAGADNVMFVCGGYYRYDEGYTPQFSGTERFAGRIVHPQQWPEDLDYTGKRVVVIGSGATAVNARPGDERAGRARDDAAALAELHRDGPRTGSDRQRAAPRPARPHRLPHHPLEQRAADDARLPAEPAVAAARQGRHRAMLKRQLPQGYDIDTHFKPRYQPWGQRMCLMPDGDLFRAIRAGRASVVTDRIATFTERGLELESGAELQADVIITAIGLNLQAFGGVQLSVDGQDVALPEAMAYKGMMLSGVPNFAFSVGYTTVSWTVKADLVCEYACRLLAHMDEHGHRQCVPVSDDPSVTERPLLDLHGRLRPALRPLCTSATCRGTSRSATRARGT